MFSLLYFPRVCTCVCTCSFMCTFMCMSMCACLLIGPKQLRNVPSAHKHQRAELLTILTAAREPDMSFPVGVEGVASEGVIIPAMTKDDKREQRTKELQKTKKRLELSELLMQRTMAKSLSLCEVRNKIMGNIYIYF